MSDDRETMRLRLLARRESDGTKERIEKWSSKLDRLHVVLEEIFASPYEATKAMAEVTQELRGHTEWQSEMRRRAEMRAKVKADGEKGK